MKWSSTVCICVKVDENKTILNMLFSLQDDKKACKTDVGRLIKNERQTDGRTHEQTD